jgi:hypothetical protein
VHCPALWPDPQQRGAPGAVNLPAECNRLNEHRTQRAFEGSAHTRGLEASRQGFFCWPADSVAHCRKELLVAVAEDLGLKQRR